jgi:hypothetical protein
MNNHISYELHAGAIRDQQLGLDPNFGSSKSSRQLPPLTSFLQNYDQRYSRVQSLDSCDDLTGADQHAELNASQAQSTPNIPSLRNRLRKILFSCIS